MGETPSNNALTQRARVADSAKLGFGAGLERAAHIPRSKSGMTRLARAKDLQVKRKARTSP